LVLSTLHPSVTISDGENKKSEMILFYNATMSGADVVDEMAKKYTVKAAS